MQGDHSLPAAALIKRHNRLSLALATWAAPANGTASSFVMSSVSWAFPSTSPLGLALTDSALRPPSCKEASLAHRSEHVENQGGGALLDGQQGLLGIWVRPSEHCHTRHSRLVECSCANTKQNHQRGHRPPTKLWKFYHTFIVSYCLLDCFAIQGCWGNSPEIIKFSSSALSVHNRNSVVLGSLSLSLFWTWLLEFLNSVWMCLLLWYDHID